MPATTHDYEKEALKLVALDRQLAKCLVHAIRAWARTKKATGRTYTALMFAAALDESLNKTTVHRGS